MITAPNYSKLCRALNLTIKQHSRGSAFESFGEVNMAEVVRFTLTRKVISRLIAIQVLVAVILGILSMIAAYFGYVMGHDRVYGFVPQLYADLEGNVPSWYSSLLILFNAGLLFVAWSYAKSRRSAYTYHWLILAIIFTFLSIDEVSSTHTYLVEPVSRMLNTGGTLYLAWVIPYGLFALVVGISYIRFLFSLPKRQGLGFFLAGAVYVFAAAGMELIESPLEEVGDVFNMYYATLASIEESLEMIGMTIFNYALLDHLRANSNSVVFFHEDELTEPKIETSS